MCISPVIFGASIKYLKKTKSKQVRMFTELYIQTNVFLPSICNGTKLDPLRADWKDTLHKVSV